MKRSSEPSTARWIITGVASLPSGRDVAEVEALGHGAVDLHRGERPRALEHVAEVEADLRAVERALARQHA